VKDKLEWMRKDAVVTYSEVFSHNLPEGTTEEDEKLQSGYGPRAEIQTWDLPNVLTTDCDVWHKMFEGRNRISDIMLLLQSAIKSIKRYAVIHSQIVGWFEG
jgi:hypothetical protein